MKKVKIKILFFLIIFNSTSIFAQISQFTVNPGIGDTQLATIPDFSLLKAFFHADKSYECSISSAYYEDYDQANSSAYRIFTENVTDSDNLQVSVNFNGNVFPQMTTLSGLHPTTRVTEAQQARQRFSIIANKMGVHNVSTNNIFPAAGIGNEQLFTCRETTLYGSYNRFFAETPIVEISNKASVSFQVLITIIGGDGTTLVNKQPSIVNPNTRTDIIFAALPANTFGQIIVTHTAPFGALEGVVAEYNQDANGRIILRRERPLEFAEKS